MKVTGPNDQEDTGTNTMSDARKRAVNHRWTHRKSTVQEKEDIAFGWDAAVEHHFEKCGTPTEPCDVIVREGSRIMLGKVLDAGPGLGLEVVMICGAGVVARCWLDRAPKEWEWLRVTWPEVE